MSLWAQINKDEEERQKKQKVEEEPKSNFWKDIGDTLAGAPKVIGDVGKGVIDAFTEGPSLIGRGIAEAVPGGGIDANEAAVDQSQQLMDQMSALYKAGKISKEKWTKYLTDSAKQDESLRKNIDESVENTDPIKQGGAVASTGLDIITAGRGSAATKAITKGGKVADAVETGLKIAPSAKSQVGKVAKDLLTGAPKGVKGTTIEGAQLGAGYGAAGKFQEEGAETTPLDVVEGVQTGALAGTLGAVLNKLGGNKLSDEPLAAPDDVIDSIVPRKAETPQISAVTTETPEETFRKATGVEPNKTMNANAEPGSIVVKPEDVTLGSEKTKYANADVDTPPESELKMEGAPGKPVPSRDLGMSINKQVQEDLGLNELDPTVIGKTSTIDAKGGRTSSLTKTLKKYIEDPITYAAKTLGNPGAETAKAAVAASKSKSDMMNEVRDALDGVNKLTKELAGKTPIARTALSKRITAALEDRANADTIITNPKEKELYNKVLATYDFFKAKMQQNGMPVREDYAPHVMIKDLNESPTYLKDALTNRTVDPTSRFSKERAVEDMEARDFDILGGLYNYANSVSTHIAYAPVIKAWHENVDKVPAALRANSGQFNDGIKYMQRMIDRSISPDSRSAGDKVLQRIQGNVYKNILWNNPKNALFAMSQRTLAKSDVSKEAKQLRKSLSDDDFKVIDEGNAFGGYTVSADTLDDRVTPRSKIGKTLEKYDINRASEEKSVKEPYRFGFAQGVTETEPYKTSIAAGKQPAEAFREAIKDEAVMKYAKDTGNIQVNSTAFGANAEARPEVLKGSVPKKMLTMFMRFPLGMTNYIRNTIQIKDTRVMDVLSKGDPRAVPIADMRNHYKVIQEGLEEAQKAAKSGKFTEIPKETLDQQIKFVKQNIDTIDKELKNFSSLRGGKRTAALARMWAATAAIQFAFDGAASAIDPEKDSPTVGGSIAKTDPSLVSSFVGQNSKLAGGLNSPANPVGPYGIKTRGVLNLIPGAGIANRATGSAISNELDKIIKGE